MTYKLLKATSRELKTLDQAITDFNPKAAPELPRAKIHRLDFSAKNEKDELLGGVQAYWVNWGILHVELIYVFEDYRNQGIASTLLKRAEQIANQNKCYLAYLSTFDFQAKDFYLKQGYSVFGVLENAPKGHARYYMKKEL